jgi:hypothetical protein
MPKKPLDPAHAAAAVAAPPVQRKLSQLVPQPTRLTKHHLQGLRALRDMDGMSIQEHIRRAVDVYLDLMLSPPSQASPLPSVPDIKTDRLLPQHRGRRSIIKYR